MGRTSEDYTRPFTFHGVDLQVDGRKKTIQGDCPFCGKEGHFYVKTSTGQWTCHRCQEKGNVSTFLKSLHQAGARITTDTELQELSQDRKVSVEALKAWEVVRHPVHPGEWLIPVTNQKGSLANVFRVVREKNSWKALGTPGQKVHPFRPGNKHRPQEPQSMIILEGPWDGMAAWDLLAAFRTVGSLNPKSRLIPTRSRDKSLLADVSVMSVPGAGTFSQDWVEDLQGLDVFAWFDNDHPKKTPTGKTVKPGWDGMKRIQAIVEKTGGPKSLHLLSWGRQGFTRDLPDGHDVRDHRDHKGTKKAALGDLLARSKKTKTVTETTRPSPKEEPALEPITRTSFSDLCDDFENSLHFTPVMRDTMAVMLAVVISTELEGDQIWVRVIGPPGSGKTTLAECIGAAKEWTVSRSVITGFHSGFVDPEARKADASMIPTINGKTFIVKDADTLISAPGRDKILSELRDIYDGTSRAQYRNRKTNIYEGLKVTFLLCGTDELRNLNRTFLGERFLDVEILGQEDRNPYLDSALENAYSRVTGSMGTKEKSENSGSEEGLHLKKVTIGFITYLKNSLEDSPIPDLPPSQGGQIKAMGQILSLMRAKVRRDAGEVAFRPRPELATRIVSQLVKMGICLAIVLGKKTIDREVIRILRKVVLDTAEGFTLEITRLLARHPKGLSTRQVSVELGIPETSVRRILNDLQEFRVVEKYTRPNNSGIRGRHVHQWVLVKSVRSLWTSGIGRRSS